MNVLPNFEQVLAVFLPRYENFTPFLRVWGSPRERNTVINPYFRKKPIILVDVCMRVSMIVQHDNKFQSCFFIPDRVVNHDQIVS